MDQNIGKLLAKLKEIGKDKNTLIMFASDNGCSAEIAKGKTASGEIGSMTRWTSLGGNWANASNTPFREAKARTFFGGIASPFVAWYPSYINSGDIISCQGNIIDLMPTILEYAGIEYPAEFQGNSLPELPGKSLKAMWEGEHQQRHEPLFFEHFGNRAVIWNDWKLVSFARKDWELYNVKNDPVEMNNLIDSLPEKAAELEKLYDNWGDSLTVLPIDEHEIHKLKREK
jgi:arylsulfatase